MIGFSFEYLLLFQKGTDHRLKRFFNKSPRKPHSGLDIVAPQGTPIKTPASGKVVLTGDFFFNGKVVYVDHGQGLISMFCHLSSISVKEGENLHKGQVLGTTSDDYH